MKMEVIEPCDLKVANNITNVEKRMPTPPSRKREIRESFAQIEVGLQGQPMGVEMVTR